MMKGRKIRMQNALLDKKTIYQSKKEVERKMQIKIMTRESSHPYLELLHAQLKNKNVEIYECESRLDLVNGLRKVDIVHLHWIEGYFSVPNHKYFTLLKSFISINYLIFVKYIARKKIAITLHNLLPHENQYPTIQHKTFELSLKLAGGVIVHNNYSKKMAYCMY